MPAAPPTPVVNLLLNALPPKELERVLAHCETVELLFGNTLCEPGQTYDYLYFPLDGFISLVTTLGPHRPLELCLIGNEGMLGATLVLGLDVAPNRAVVQGSGRALRISTARLGQALRESPHLLRALKRYLYVLTMQLAQNVACAHFHAVEPRLARWLLMSHDRAHSDHLTLTHEFLADMLGVRRSGVTIAAGALQVRSLIHYSRGKITILDRPGLEAAACECYGALNQGYARLLSPHPPPPPSLA
ncbi:Crp/Fnr family transcriptional regulator [Aquipseudomonas ullengensis]|uniref:Crp/Fnr family transcriptional regulator n=1 Tax=Aquipseudomonas ullengensis TaxID=2759166 RepID=A0A7W4QCA5_9GAMM|nr:Crp/Fnr family transcriptional regulator [Pseudomonas ullengensis]MBB2497504.1 Crp/Fnr family transcriptional regulator [Pseudomonas ullengensis]